MDELFGASFSSAATALSISGTSARTSALTRGFYWLVSDVDAFSLVGGASVTAAIPAAGASSPPLFAKSPVLVFLDGDANTRVAGITTGATGTLYIVPAKR